MRIRPFHLLLALVAALSLGGALAQERLVVAGGAEATGLDPRRVNDVPSFKRIYLMYEPLIAFEKDLTYRPRLATDWSVSEDGSEITLNLRQGVKFHHGKEFTSEDVKYTIEWMTNPDNPVLNRTLWASLTGVETPDPYTVVVSVDPPNVWALNLLARLLIVPSDLGELESFPANPVGTGPYQFVEWVRDDRLVVRAFADYWDDERGNVSEVVVRAIPEDASRLLAFEAGEIDLFHEMVVPVEVPRLEAETNWVSRAVGTGWTYLGFNQSHPVLGNAKVRQAFYHLIPAEAIVQRVYNGVATLSYSPISPESIYYSNDVPRYPYDPERARELFAEAGFADGFTVRLHTNSENSVRMRIAEILQFEAAQLGITIEFTGEEFAAFIARVLAPEKDFDLFVLGWGNVVDPDYATYQLFLSTATNNYGGYNNPRVDELLTLGRVLPPNSPESIAAYQEAQNLIMADVPFAFINNTEEIGLVQDWVQGWSVHPYSSATYMDLHKLVVNR
jgi:peptide/nickel transport system substrate-binding protein